MRITLIPIGNSKGIIIPGPIIKELGIKDEMNLELKQDMMIIRPANPREKWALAFQKMAEREEDQMYIQDVFQDESFEEWE
jgi:antitoxin MazE